MPAGDHVCYTQAHGLEAVIELHRLQRSCDYLKFGAQRNMDVSKINIHRSETIFLSHGVPTETASYEYLDFQISKNVEPCSTKDR